MLTENVVAVFDRCARADVDAHRGVKLQRVAAGSGLRRAEHHADLLAQLVDEDTHRVGARNSAGEFTHSLRHKARLQPYVSVAHITLNLALRRQSRH